MLSAIQTRVHQIVDLAFAPVLDLSEEERAGRTMTCQHRLMVSQNPEQPLIWLARLRVAFVHAENGPRSLYLGHCEMIAEFELHPEFPEKDREKFVSLNSGAILYGSIREWFATLSARSLHGLAELPTIDARVFIPKGEAAPAPTAAVDPK